MQFIKFDKFSPQYSLQTDSQRDLALFGRCDYFAQFVQRVVAQMVLALLNGQNLLCKRSMRFSTHTS